MSGRVDPVRIKKQSFYAHQAVQSDEPAIYLVGHWNYPTDPNAYVYELKDAFHRYTGQTALRDAANKTVYVIGSQHLAKVELYINGELVGEDTAAGAASSMSSKASTSCSRDILKRLASAPPVKSWCGTGLKRSMK